ncbi:MAG: hypothetical protein H6774_03680 [Pseudomonadales bacterium]|nr:hypothetical protein [Candidatus Woesebacteria bacterium]MCB9802162.1 hypothetical protein [Pseudomonadales bacterium]
MMSNTQCAIQDLRAQQQKQLVESLAVMVGSLFAASFLPQLILRYLYDGGLTLTQEPKIFEYLTLAVFLIGFGHLLYSLIVNFTRSNKIKLLQQELDDMSGCCGGSCGCDDDLTDQELQELEAIVNETLEQSETQPLAKAMAKKSSAKKSTKKSPKKKTKKTK